MRKAQALKICFLFGVLEFASPISTVAFLPSEEDAMRSVDIYFLDSELELLRAFPVSIFLAKSLTLQAKQVVELVSRPAQGSQMVSAVPDGTKVREIYIDPRGLAFVDLSVEFIQFQLGGSLSEILAVYSIVNSLTANFEEIQYVQIFIEGRHYRNDSGHIDIQYPLTFDNDWVVPE